MVVNGIFGNRPQRIQMIAVDGIALVPLVAAQHPVGVDAIQVLARIIELERYEVGDLLTLDVDDPQNLTLFQLAGSESMSGCGVTLDELAQLVCHGITS